ncbi:MULTISPECIES: ABC transporter permease [unclassified Arthrobacter]|uniref:ABC transporter permease n=1 Tax=unclassified Arthrobacter TaxID=235627 RepID=UPI0014912DB9|nr:MULTISPECIES: ABC transporter permease [unclassified Arthrobacter]MBE0008233.1 ABC transporter permease [Arthrobacter sp. AET 35A]NOJ61972.1 ABC transporter permease [Arthrobacter sp. 147(2020)]
MSTSTTEQPGSTGASTDLTLSYWNGVKAVFGLEMRQRLRARAWYIMLVIWFFVIGLVFLLASVTTAATEGSGAILFDLVVGFVLFFGLLVAPGLSANAVNGDRAAGTLAILQITLLTPGQILWGKWLASWVASLAFLLVSSPFIFWALALGGVNPAEAFTSLLMLSVELGIVSAIGIGISALANRPLFSIVTTYMVVALLGIGTLITFGLSYALVDEENVEVTYSYLDYPPGTDFSAPIPASVELECVTRTQLQTVHHTDRTTWLLAANPFVIVADSVPYSRGGDFGQVSQPANPDVYVQPGIMEGISVGVRLLQAGPDYETTCEEAQGFGRDLPDDSFPIWPLGLVLQSALAGGLLWLGRGKLATPARRLAQGTRIA